MTFGATSVITVLNDRGTFIQIEIQCIFEESIVKELYLPASLKMYFCCVSECTIDKEICVNFFSSSDKNYECYATVIYVILSYINPNLNIKTWLSQNSVFEKRDRINLKQPFSNFDHFFKNNIINRIIVTFGYLISFFYFFFINK